MYSGKFTATAMVPEQMGEYVQAIAGSRMVECGDFAAYVNGENMVIVAYPNAESTRMEPWNAEEFSRVHTCWERQMEDAVRQGMEHKEIRVFNVLSPTGYARAPEGSKELRNDYWGLKVPVRVKSKLGSALRRAGREIEISHEAWGREHKELTQRYHERHWVDPGTRYIWKNVGSYTGASPGAKVFCARRSGILQAVAVADYSSYFTAFYMFAFRAPDAVPGTADLLLWEIAQEAQNRGHAYLNLGLGVNEPITFFKKKWNAVPFLPYIQTQWRLAPPRHPKWWGRLLNLGG